MRPGPVFSSLAEPGRELDGPIGSRFHSNMKSDIPLRAFEAVCYAALLLSGPALLARALLGPFAAGPFSVHSPVKAQCIFALALVLLMVLRVGAEQDSLFASRRQV